MSKIIPLLIVTFFLPMFFSCSAGNDFQVYNTIFRSSEYQNINPKHIKFWYYGSSDTQDYFVLVRKKIVLNKDHIESGYPPFLSDEDRFKFEGWNDDRRKRLIWKFIEYKGRLKLVLKLQKDISDEDFLEALNL